MGVPPGILPILVPACLGKDVTRTRFWVCRALLWGMSQGAFAQGQPSSLPKPSDLPLLDYEGALYPFIADRAYARLGWTPDKGWRDTGPFVLGSSYGVHPAVRIYSSPEVIDWLEGGRLGAVPDGAMVVKEMVTPPSARDIEYRQMLDVLHPDAPARVEAEMMKDLRKDNNLHWTVMVRDSALSHVGWVFASVAQNAQVDSFEAPFNPPSGQAGVCQAGVGQAATLTSSCDSLGAVLQRPIADVFMAISILMLGFRLARGRKSIGPDGASDPLSS